MATVVNDRDVLIINAAKRFSVATDQGMFVTPSSAVFKVLSGTTGSPSSVTFTATLLNMTGTVDWTWTTGLAPDKTGNTLTLDYANMSAVSGTVTATITVDGATYTQTATVAKVADGTNGISSITGFLTNEAATLAASSAGVVSSFAGAGGTFRVFDGTMERTGAAVTYSAPAGSQVGCTVSIDASGAYAVSAMSADSASAVLQAVYGGVTLQKTLTLSKSKAGANGADAIYVVISAPSQVFTRADSSSAFAPTSIDLTVTAYGGTATALQWQYMNTSGIWTDVGGARAPTYTVPVGFFTGARTYRILATIGGVVYSDQISLVQVTGGKDGSAGIRGTVSISAATSATSWAAGNATVDNEATAAIASAGYGAPQTRDIVTLYNQAAKFSKTKFWSGSAWTDVAQVIDGNLLVTGSVTTAALATDSVTADKIKSKEVTSDKISAGSVSAITAVFGMMRTATTGARIEISDNLIEGFASNNVKRFRISAS